MQATYIRYDTDRTPTGRSGRAQQDGVNGINGTVYEYPRFVALKQLRMLIVRKYEYVHDRDHTDS